MPHISNVSCMPCYKLCTPFHNVNLMGETNHKTGVSVINWSKNSTVDQCKHSEFHRTEAKTAMYAVVLKVNAVHSFTAIDFDRIVRSSFMCVKYNVRTREPFTSTLVSLELSSIAHASYPQCCLSPSTIWAGNNLKWFCIEYTRMLG